MGEKEAYEALKAALLREAEKSPRERFQAMVDRGAIDAEGRVLIRGPEPIRRESKPKKKAD